MKSCNFRPEMPEPLVIEAVSDCSLGSSFPPAKYERDCTRDSLIHGIKSREFGRFWHSDDAASSATSRTNRKRLIFAVQ